MELITLPLVDWSNGIIMLGVFAIVVVLLVVVLMSLINSEKKDEA